MKVAIIGAGTIGLYIANKLAELGHQVSIFEKKSEPTGKICSGLISQRLWKFIDYDNEFVKKEFDYCFIHFNHEICKLNFLPKHYLVDRDAINKFLGKKAIDKGVKIYFNNFIEELPSGFDRIIACDGASSIVRTILNVGKPKIYLGARIFLKNKNGLKDIHTWSQNEGFFWAIPHKEDIEYGGMGNPKDISKDFSDFLQTLGIDFKKENIDYAIIPQGLIVSKNNKIVLCGDCAGMTKPWSGGGVIWGLTAADILIKTFPDFSKYNQEVKKFFQGKIRRGRAIKKITYYLGQYFPFIIPKEWSRDNDFPII